MEPRVNYQPITECGKYPRGAQVVLQGYMDGKNISRKPIDPLS